MGSLIDIFKMDQINKETRIKIIIKLGIALNNQFASNITESLVYELVLALDPNHPIKNDEHYLRYIA